MAISGEAKKVYQRELMRERRATAKQLKEGLAERLPWPLNKEKPPRWGEGIPNYIPPTLEEKAAMDENVVAGVGEPQKPMDASQREWEMCLERAERARAYAEAMPKQVKPSEEVFGDPVWQWENEVFWGS
ncbi:MAG: hypothetical protein DMF62_00490 [Acidobacteria bacterium]|nr:MAG: hypothetical protein DMF62_00490 [Acidobacteriota bacterium]